MAANKPKSNEIKITRVYDAPVKLVWDAWNDPKQAAKWWGPRGWSITTKSKDLRVGGHWHYIMHGPDGVEIPNTTKYHEVVMGSRLVYDHGGHEDRPHLFRVTANFIELRGGKTKLEMTMGFATPEIAEETRKFIKKANGDSTWDRLAEYLTKESTGKDEFVINRSFDCPLETMYEMWTHPDHFPRWLPPTGMNMKFIRAEMREGGTSFYSMTSLDGKITMHGQVRYRELRRPDRIVYEQSFVDANEKPSRHPFAPNFPATMRTTVTLTEEGPDRTRVTVRWEPLDANAAELAEFVQMRAGMTGGWTGSFDKLDEYLAAKTA